MPPTLEQRLAAVRAADPATTDGRTTVRDAVRSATGVLVAAAVRRIAEDRIDALVDELAPAFERLLEQPGKRDPGCRGTCAIAIALHALDRWDDRVFVAGLRHVQREGPGRGDDRVDSAAELRALCAMAHAQFGRDDALDVLAAALADRDRVTRLGAARGLGDAGRRDASALLRYKLLVGDSEPEVLAACVESLLAVGRDAAPAFLFGLLADHDDRAEVVALGLGGARIAGATEAIRAWCLGASTEQRHRVGYLALALLRDDAATTYLLDLVRDADPPGALAAAKALATFREDAALVDAVRTAARARKARRGTAEIETLLDD